MKHPFEIGEQYRNRSGSYEVLAIQAPKMLIRYEDGRQDMVTIDIQARIWQAMKDEESLPQAAAAKSPGAGKPRGLAARQGHAFDGLQESDFKDNVIGTRWRSRDSLGGRLAQQLSAKTPHEFRSYAIYRRPSVYLAVPDYYDRENGLPYAKYELRLSSAGAQYGFYVERAGQGGGMDSTWHWWPFLNALERDTRLQELLEDAMPKHALYWSLQPEEPDRKGNFHFTRTMTVRPGAPLVWDETDAISWSEFAGRLRSVPADNWLNVHLCAWADKSEALEAGARFADRVTSTLAALLPLYLAAART